jgi:hypothetical protein
MNLQHITENDEIKVGDVLVDRHPVTLQETKVTVARVTKTQIVDTWGSRFQKDGTSTSDRFLRWHHRLFKEV